MSDCSIDNREVTLLVRLFGGLVTGMYVPDLPYRRVIKWCGSLTGRLLRGNTREFMII